MIFIFLFPKFFCLHANFNITKTLPSFIWTLPTFLPTIPYIGQIKKESRPTKPSQSFKFTIPKTMSFNDIMKQVKQRKSTTEEPKLYFQKFDNIKSPKSNMPTIQHPLFGNYLREPIKIKNKQSLTYKNVPASVIEILRKRLNEDHSLLNSNIANQVQTPAFKSPSSSCTFLAGSFSPMMGYCSKYGACRQRKLEYGNHVSIQTF